MNQAPVIMLICGGRKYNDYHALDSAMQSLGFKPDLVVHGDAPGADTLGKQWAKMNGIHYAAVPALWDTYHKAAGPLRNSAMLIINITHCLALPGQTGTADMIQKCTDRGIPVWSPYGQMI